MPTDVGDNGRSQFDIIVNNDERGGRLRQYRDRTEYGYDIDYQFTDSNTQLYGDKLWQIAQVTDAGGQVATSATTANSRLANGWLIRLPIPTVLPPVTVTKMATCNRCSTRTAVSLRSNGKWTTLAA